MKIELLIIAITIFFILNVHSDGKYIKLVKSWKKYYQMAGIGFVGLSAYLFLKKHPTQSRHLLSHANGIIKYMPIDKESSDLLSPLLDMSRRTFGGADMSAQERIIRNSGRVAGGMAGGMMAGGGAHSGSGAVKTVKRSVSETKKNMWQLSKGGIVAAVKNNFQLGLK